MYTLLRGKIAATIITMTACTGMGYADQANDADVSARGGGAAGARRAYPERPYENRPYGEGELNHPGAWGADAHAFENGEAAGAAVGGAAGGAVIEDAPYVPPVVPVPYPTQQQSTTTPQQ